MNRRRFLYGAGFAALQQDAVRRVEAAARGIAGKTADEVAADEDFWFEVRHAFTIDRNVINLNNGSVCPSPKVVQDAMRHYLEVMNMQPSYYVDEFLMPGSETVRRRLAETFGCSAEEVAITRNATEALEIVQLGLDLK